MSERIKGLKREMMMCYGTLCWLSLQEEKRLTMHHIIPIRFKGKTEWNNIALLSNDSHIYFNYLERVMPSVARELNEIFYELNRTFRPPDTKYESEVKRILSRFK